VSTLKYTTHWHVPSDKYISQRILRRILGCDADVCPFFKAYQFLKHAIASLYLPSSRHASGLMTAGLFILFFPYPFIYSGQTLWRLRSLRQNIPVTTHVGILPVQHRR